jgi:dihydroorotase (multifunctional complex type)
MSPYTVVRGARMFAAADKPPVDLVFREAIVEVAPAGTASGDRVIDADGLLALPGAIDAHVHPIHDETFANVGNAAALGGVTTVLHHLYPDVGEPFAEAVARMCASAQHGAADFGAHVRIDRTRLGQPLTPVAELGERSVKAFLAHPDPNVQMSLGELVRVMRACADAGLTLVVHAELGDAIDALAAEGLAGDPPGDTLESLSAWRSDHIEAAAVEAATALAQRTGCTLYIAHVSSAAALTAAQRARLRGQQVFVETCPHYLFLTADDDLGGLGRVLPPLRSRADRDTLRAAVAAGTVDAVGSDHCGHGPHAKRRDDVAGSKAGLPGVELLLPLLLDAALEGRWLSPAGLVSVLAEGPARVFGLDRKGALEPGRDADIVLVDPAATRAVTRADLHDASFYTPYEGRSLRGDIVQVWRRGELVANGRIAVAQGGGRHVRAPVALEAPWTST